MYVELETRKVRANYSLMSMFYYDKSIKHFLKFVKKKAIIYFLYLISFYRQ